MDRRPSDDGELVPLPVVRRRGAQPEWGPPDGTAPDPSAPAWLPRLVVIGALLAALIAGGALSGVGRQAAGDRRAVGGGTPPSPGGDEPAPDGWRRGSPGPLHHREFAVRVWTGSELVVWGGDPDGDSGAAYDPAADLWRNVAPAPIPARCQGVSAWTGREMLVWGQACRLTPGPSPGRSRYATAGAAYDPSSDRWRVLPEAPVTAGSATVSAWTGTEWVLGNPVGPAAAYDPAADRWRTLTPVPRRFSTAVGQWTGREVLVLATEILEKGPSTGAVYQHWASAFDPAANRWRALPDPPLELAATGVWDGRRLVAWDMNLHAVALDPAGQSGWEPLPDLPVDFTDCSPQGARLGEAVFAAECGRGALFRPWTGAWERIPHPRSLAEVPVWTGRDALFWTGRFAGSADGIWLYRPSAVVPDADGRHRRPVPMSGAAR